MSFAVDKDNLNIKKGNIARETFEAGVYNWGSDVRIDGDANRDAVTIEGDCDDHFVFQTTGSVLLGSSAKILLQASSRGVSALACTAKGLTGPQLSNIVWVVAHTVVAGTDSKLKGIFLVKEKAVFETRASLVGRVFSQTAVTLDQVNIHSPST